MSDKIVSIDGSPLIVPAFDEDGNCLMPPNDEVVETLKWMLEMAEQGYMQELIVTMQVGTDIISDSYGYCGNPYTMYGHASDNALTYREIFLIYGS